jgi:peptidoglycan/LPS O-acetylase OafA/YrhL
MNDITSVRGQGTLGERSARLHYLDWLRILAILGVFFYHAARPFIHQDWLIRNAEQSIFASLIFLVFLGSWGMPLFFLMAGTGSLFALRRRSIRQFIKERAARLLVPFIVGCVLLSPIQFYAEWVHKGWYEGPFLSFLPELVADRLSQKIGPAVFESLGSHLWFLGFLFSFSLLALPIFRWLRSDTGRRFVNRLGQLGEKRGGLLLFIIPVAVARIILQPLYPGYTDWSDFIYMFLFFVYGYILYSNERFVQAIRRDGWLALGLGMVCTIIIVGVLAAGYGQEWIDSPGTPGFYVAWTLASINGWCWTVFALSFGMRVLNFRNAWLNYGQEAILPFYVFHQPVIVAIAVYAVTWNTGVAPKLLVITGGGLLLTLALYELLVRRVPPARALFGVKPAMRGSG